jgi:hypothetical protein
MMQMLSGVIAGIAGTLAMTLFMRLASVVTGFNFHVPSILGTMLTFDTKPSGATSDSPRSLISGYVLHYIIGILFALIYQQAWLKEHISTFGTALFFGAVAGLVGVIFWATALKWHPRAPSVNRRQYLVFIFLGHLVFALVMHLAFVLFPGRV